MVLVVFTYLLVPFPMVYTTKWPIFGHCIVQLTLSYFFGIICALLAELPALNLERIIFQDGHKNTAVQLAKNYGLQQSKLPTSDEICIVSYKEDSICFF